VDLITLKKLLGHAHFTTTAGYLHVTAERGAELPDPLACAALKG
jgi:site-specific recombinase XerD